MARTSPVASDKILPISVQKLLKSMSRIDNLFLFRFSLQEGHEGMQQETENVNNQVSKEVKKEKAFPESSQDGYRMSGTKMRSAPIDRSCPSPHTQRLMRFVALRE